MLTRLPTQKNNAIDELLPYNGLPAVTDKEASFGRFAATSGNRRFGIDSFSVRALQKFKIDSVKLDRELIQDAGQGGEADRILEAIIAMVHAINVKVVGVGVAAARHPCENWLEDDPAKHFDFFEAPLWVTVDSGKLPMPTKKAAEAAFLRTLCAI